MAGYDDGNGVAADGLANGLRGAAPDVSGNIAIADSVSVGYRKQLLPYSELELCSLWTKRRQEIGISASEIDVKPADGFRYRLRQTIIIGITINAGDTRSEPQRSQRRAIADKLENAVRRQICGLKLIQRLRCLGSGSAAQVAFTRSAR